MQASPSKSDPDGPKVDGKSLEYIWQDREVRFDQKAQNLACRRGEKIIDSINSVEDTKGKSNLR